MIAILAAAVVLCAPVAIDGDTLRDCHGVRWRLARIDAPERPGHCRRGRRCAAGDWRASWAALAAMIAGQQVRCRIVDASPARQGFQPADRYGRPVARCVAGGVDLGAALRARGLAVGWH